MVRGLRGLLGRGRGLKTSLESLRGEGRAGLCFYTRDLTIRPPPPPFFLIMKDRADCLSGEERSELRPSVQSFKLGKGVQGGIAEDGTRFMKDM